MNTQDIKKEDMDKGKRMGKPRSRYTALVIEGEEFDSRLLDLTRVTRVTGGGKRLRFRAVVVIGNKKGKVGIGVAKGLDVAQAIEKATRLAKKNIVEVPIINDTIPHEILAKFGAAEIILKPQRKGRGLVAGGVVRVICQLAGIRDISSKIIGKTTNKLNNAQAVMAGFKELKLKEATYAATRIKSQK